MDLISKAQQSKTSELAKDGWKLTGRKNGETHMSKGNEKIIILSTGKTTTEKRQKEIIKKLGENQMNNQEQYRKSANHFMNETYEMDTEGDMAIESAKEAFSTIINSNDFLNMMKNFIDVNELAPDEESSMIVIEEFKNTILPEVESLLTRKWFGNK